jgi:hypothetical protein
MVLEFQDSDLDTPTEDDLKHAYGGQYLSQEDIGDRKVKAKILKVRKAEMKSDNGAKRTKFVIWFSNLDKGMVCNATNKDALVDALGRTPASWIGADVGIWVDPTVSFGGKRVGGLRLRVLNQHVPGPAPAPKVAAPKPAAAAPEWPVEAGDPGFEPAPDFDDAA